MRLLRPKLAKKWVDADDEIAKVCQNHGKLAATCI